MDHLNRLREHMIRTYINLRVGMGFIALGLPVTVWAVGMAWDDAPWQCSISAYYWASPTGAYHARVFFVGGLFAVAAFLYLYKGFTRLENYLLNAAAVFAAGVAVFPMQWTGEAAKCGGLSIDKLPPDAPGGGFLSVHGTSAVLMFVCLFFVVWLCARSTLHYVQDPKLREQYRLWYKVIAVVMLASPLIAVVLNLVVGGGTHFVFLAEAVGIGSFAAFWLLKSDEVAKSDARRVAMTQPEQERALPPV